MMMKKYASLLFALVLALSLSVSAAADSSGVYVYDDAALLTQEEYDTLTASAMAVADQYGCGVYVVTVDDMADYIDPDAVTETDETGMAAFTEYAWDALGLAASYDSNGIMLALSMAERDFQMLAHGATPPPPPSPTTASTSCRTSSSTISVRTTGTAASRTTSPRAAATSRPTPTAPPSTWSRPTIPRRNMNR